MGFLVQSLIVYVSFTISTLANLLLIYLIRSKAHKHMGSYKYLMFSFCALELTSATIGILNQPMIHIGKGAFIMFSSNPLQLSHSLAVYFNNLNYTCYGLTICLLAVHFVYRYFAVCNSTLLVLFTFPYSIMWIAIFFEMGIEWWATSTIFASGSPEMNNLLRLSMWETFNLDIDKVAYTGPHYYKRDERGVEVLNWASVLYVLNLAKIVMISFLTVIFCGFATFRKMSVKHANTSRRTFEMQKQLFRALVVQTLIPLTIMYLPTVLMFIIPLFKVSVGFFDELLLFSFTVYPVLDPLAVLYLVREYQRAIRAMFKLKVDLMGSVILKIISRSEPPVPPQRQIHYLPSNMGVLY